MHRFVVFRKICTNSVDWIDNDCLLATLDAKMKTVVTHVFIKESFLKKTVLLWHILPVFFGVRILYTLVQHSGRAVERSENPGVPVLFGKYKPYVLYVLQVKSAVALKWQVGFENGMKMTPIFTIIFISKMLTLGPSHN